MPHSSVAHVLTAYRFCLRKQLLALKNKSLWAVPPWLPGSAHQQLDRSLVCLSTPTLF
jgi:hypothetical protein